MVIFYFRLKQKSVSFQLLVVNFNWPFSVLFLFKLNCAFRFKFTWKQRWPTWRLETEILDILQGECAVKSDFPFLIRLLLILLLLITVCLTFLLKPCLPLFSDWSGVLVNNAGEIFYVHLITGQFLSLNTQPLKTKKNITIYLISSTTPGSELCTGPPCGADSVSGRHCTYFYSLPVSPQTAAWWQTWINSRSWVSSFLPYIQYVYVFCSNVNLNPALSLEQSWLPEESM